MREKLKGASAVIAIVLGFTLGPSVVAVSAGIAAVNAWNDVPESLAINDPLPQHTKLLASDGSIFATLFAENRVPVKLEDVSQYVIDAVISTEDARFYSHHGVDPIGTARALINNLRGAAVQGGSTITQQYVKNLLLINAKNSEDAKAATSDNFGRKLREARYAMALERKLSKEEILEGYLNAVNFGDGSYGIGAAAMHYFNKSAADLTLAESALLAGIIQNPSRLNPVKNPDEALDRRQHVLNRMVLEGKITQAVADAASEEPLVLDLTRPANGCVVSEFPLYCQWVRQTLESDPVFGASEEQRREFLYRGGLTIQTALDPAIQRKVDIKTREALDPKGRIATGVAIVEPGTGKVVALSMNKPFGQKEGQTELLLPTLNMFQPGSTFKPITAITAIEQGWDINTYITAPATVRPANRNYPDDGFHNAGDGPGGTTDMAGAIRHSINTWFIILEDRIGIKPIAKMANDLGMLSVPTSGPRAVTEKDASLTLGSYETSPLQMAAVYASIAARGKSCLPVGILDVKRIDGAQGPVPDASCKQVIRVSTADTLVNMMRGVIDGNDGGRTGSAASIGRPAGGKTGSTNDFGAAWFAGYTPQYAAAVWVGDPRGPKYNMRSGVRAFGNQFYAPVYGGTIPARIWKSVMLAVHEGLPVVDFPNSGGDAALSTRVIVPEVRGMTVETALRVLKDAGLEGRAIESRSKMGVYQPGVVGAQSPVAGTTILGRGRTVTITFYRTS